MPKLSLPHTLMIIDDSRFDQLIISRTAEHTRLFKKIIVMPGAMEALEHLTKNLQNQQELPQLILLDIQMPEMNGFEFIDHFAQLPTSFTDTCGVIMLSSTDDLTDIEKAGSNPYIIKLLKKPLRPDVLTGIINEHFVSG